MTTTAEKWLSNCQRQWTDALTYVAFSIFIQHLIPIELAHTLSTMVIQRASDTPQFKSSCIQCIHILSLKNDWPHILNLRHTDRKHQNIRVEKKIQNSTCVYLCKEKSFTHWGIIRGNVFPTVCSGQHWVGYSKASQLLLANIKKSNTNRCYNHNIIDECNISSGTGCVTQTWHPNRDEWSQPVGLFCAFSNIQMIAIIFYWMVPHLCMENKELLLLV